MADTKISALTALTGANVDTAADVLAIVDTDTATTKKILIDELRTALGIATQAEQETATSLVKTVTPGRQHFHPSAAKAWVYFTQSGTTVTVEKSHNVSGVVRNSAGNYTVSFTTAFSDAEYGWSVNHNADRSVVSSAYPTLLAGSFQFELIRTVDSAAQEVSKCACIFFGDQ